jgi:hypothetical protein
MEQAATWSEEKREEERRDGDEDDGGARCDREVERQVEADET